MTFYGHLEIEFKLGYFAVIPLVKSTCSSCINILNPYTLQVRMQGGDPITLKLMIECLLDFPQEILIQPTTMEMG